MAFCGKCGGPVEDGTLFCPHCGAAQTNSPDQTPEHEETLAEVMDHTAEYDEMDIQQNKVMAVLAYLGILVLIPVFAAKESGYARYHANQGLVLFIVSTVWRLCRTLLVNLCNALHIWLLSGLISYAMLLGSLVLYAGMVIGVIFAAQGKAKELPFIGQIKILKESR